MSTQFAKLDRIIRLRTDARNLAAQSFMESQRAEALLAEEVARVERVQLGLRERRLALSQCAKLDVTAVVECQRYEAVLGLQLSLHQENAGRLAAETERRRQLLVEANRAVRVIEILRQRRASDAATQERKLEIRQFDEVAILRYVRGLATGDDRHESLGLGRG